MFDTSFFIKFIREPFNFDSNLVDEGFLMDDICGLEEDGEIFDDMDMWEVKILTNVNTVESPVDFVALPIYV